VATLQFGSVVWVTTRDPNGVNPKKRPAVVLSPTEEIHRGSDLRLVAITGTLPDTLTEDYISLPWQAQGRCATGLKKRSAVYCAWLLLDIPQGEVSQPTGRVPGALLDQIVDRIRALDSTLSG